MRIILTSLLFFSACNSAEQRSQNLPELMIKNNSNQDITIYYHDHHHTSYIVINPLTQKIIKLSVPQHVTVHFNKLNYQQKVNIDHTREPLLIQHENSLSVMQNGKQLSPKLYFDNHRPNLTVHEDSSIN